MLSSLKKILWISDVEGWAYENRYNRIRKYSNYDHIQILITGLTRLMIEKMIIDVNADIIIAQNPGAFKLIREEDVHKSITILSGERCLLGWQR